MKSTPELLQTLKTEFKKTFHEEPGIIVRAPGRVNLIGEHTDYNEGFVLPIAIDRSILIALRPRPDRIVALRSLDFNARLEFHLDELKLAGGWSDYVQGIAWGLQQRGHTLSGWEGLSISNVPMGSGLSSSAAIQIAVGRAFSAVSGLPWDGAAMAVTARFADNEWMGLKSGVMDQMISACGEKDKALLIDCRSNTFDAYPMPTGAVPVAMFTGKSRGLTASQYNQRVDECRQAADFFGAQALRDVSMEMFEAKGEDLADVPYRRARHIISENERTLQAAKAMQADDLETLSRLMDASHASLRDDYEVSCFELDTIVEIAKQQPGCYAARMTGAGFGGSAVAMVAPEHVEAFVATVPGLYQAQTMLEPNVFACQAANGSEVVEGVKWNRIR